MPLPRWIEKLQRIHHLALRVGGRHLADQQAGQCPDHRQRNQDQPDDVLFGVEVVRQHAAQHGAQDRCQERQRLQHAVALREQFGFEYLGHGAVFSRHEEGRMRAHQENGGKHDPGAEVGHVQWAAEDEAEQGQTSNADFGEFPIDERVTLAVFVGEVACQRGEHGPGREEQDRHQRDGRFLRQRFAIDGEEHRRGVDRLIVERR